MNRSRAIDQSQSQNPRDMTPQPAHSTVSSVTGARERFLSYPRVESFRSFDFDAQKQSSTTNETETSCRNCSYICATFTCPVCGTYNAPHHERPMVSSRGDGAHEKDTGDSLKSSPPPPSLGIDTSKRKKKATKSRSRSRKMREKDESLASYIALPDLGDSDLREDGAMPYPTSSITPAPRRRAMLREEHRILSTTPMRTQIRFLATTKSESDLPRTQPNPDRSGRSTRTMNSEYPLRASLSPIRQGFRDRNDMQRAITNGSNAARACPREERGFDGTRHSSSSSGSSILQASERHLSVAVPSDKPLPTSHLLEEIAIDTVSPPATPDNLTMWSDEERNKPWECKTCTFVNENPLHLSCSICGVLREIGRQGRPSPTAFEEQMAFLRGETQQATVQFKCKKLEEEWFVKLQERRMEELFQLQTEYLRKVCGGI